jgi:hypothetical protein
MSPFKATSFCSPELEVWLNFSILATHALGSINDDHREQLVDSPPAAMFGRAARLFLMKG